MPRFNPDDYIDVQDRITRFWSEYPDGRIETDLLSDPDTFDQVVFRSRVYKHQEHVHPDATGIASEYKSGSGPQATSWHEVGETSAIGRALANMGYATSSKDRPSRQGMSKVNGGPDYAAGEVAGPTQHAPQTTYRAGGTSGPSEKQMGFIRKLAHDLKLSDDQLNGYVEKEYGAPLDALQGRDVSNLIDRMKAKVDA